MSQAVADGLVLAGTAFVIVLLAVSLVVAFKLGRPVLNDEAKARLDTLIAAFEAELRSEAQARARARGWSEISRKDIQAEYRRRRAGRVRAAFRVLLSYRAFSLAAAGLIFALPVVPHFPALSDSHRMIADGAGASVAFATFGLEGSELAARFRREPKSGDRAGKKLRRYCGRLRSAVAEKARSQADGSPQATSDDIHAAWRKLVKPYEANRKVTSQASGLLQGLLPGLGRLLTALVVGAGLYLGASFAKARLLSDSYWQAAAIPLALLIAYLILANGLPGSLKLALSVPRLASNGRRRTKESAPPYNSPVGNNALKEKNVMAYGGSATKRQTFSFARVVTLVGEAIGLLNKGSSNMPAAPASDASGQAVSSNSLNVTRVGGVGALISGAGGAALLLFKVNKSKDPHSIVVAAYISVGVIVAAALVAVAMIIVADIRARTSLASASASAPAPAPLAQVKYIQAVAAGAADMAVSLDRAYDFVIVNATATGLRLTLPMASSARWQQMSIKREDNAGDKVVTLLAQNTDQVLGQREYRLPAANPVQLYSNGESWLAVQ